MKCVGRAAPVGQRPYLVWACSFKRTAILALIDDDTRLYVLMHFKLFLQFYFLCDFTNYHLYLSRTSKHFECGPQHALR